MQAPNKEDENDRPIFVSGVHDNRSPGSINL